MKQDASNDPKEQSKTFKKEGETNNVKKQQHCPIILRAERSRAEGKKSAEKEISQVVEKRISSPEKITEDIFWSLKKLNGLEMSESFFPIRSLN